MSETPTKEIFFKDVLTGLQEVLVSDSSSSMRAKADIIYYHLNLQGKFAPDENMIQLGGRFVAAVREKRDEDARDMCKAFLRRVSGNLPFFSMINATPSRVTHNVELDVVAGEDATRPAKRFPELSPLSPEIRALIREMTERPFTLDPSASKDRENLFSIAGPIQRENAMRTFLNIVSLNPNAISDDLRKDFVEKSIDEIARKDASDSIRKIALGILTALGETEQVPSPGREDVQGSKPAPTSGHHPNKGVA